ncbi:MAG: glycosyltransferase family 4 protein [Nitrospirota bacterium]|nr:glycosyltransferase family 4 protein [Nitrospirota bacterium]
MMERFRILHTESSHGLGGQEYRILSEAKAMSLRGHQVVIAAPGHSQLARLAIQEDIPCEDIPIGISGWGRLVPAFLSLIKKHQIQIVHTHGSQDSWTASVAGRLSSARPVIIRARHKSTPISVSFRHDVLYRFLPHAVMTTGEAVRQQLIACNGLKPDAVFSIPTGVDMQRFHSGPLNVALKEALGIQVDLPIVGTVSFLRPEKGLDVLIDAVSLLQEEHSRVCCLIVGGGQERQRLVEHIRQRNLEKDVVLAGFREDIPELLNLMDVFVLPSLEEGMPQSLLQALAMERAVVASAVGGVPEIVRDGQTGFLVTPKDPLALADKIGQLLRDPAQRNMFGQAGRRVIEQAYSMEAMVIKTEQLYSSLWAERAKRAA